LSTFRTIISNARLNVSFLAQGGHPNGVSRCPLLGAKRASRLQIRMSAFDPKRT
jgi:hypothetical protein